MKGNDNKREIEAIPRLLSIPLYNHFHSLIFSQSVTANVGWQQENPDADSLSNSRYLSLLSQSVDEELITIKLFNNKDPKAQLTQWKEFKLIKEHAGKERNRK